MIRTVASKVMWVGRATVFLVGLAVIVGLIFGILSRATAHTGSAGLFHLNHNNPVSALSTLTGTLTGAVLKVDNNGSGTALNLEVQNPTNKPPMLVNSSTKVANLNSDLLDGKDSGAFWSGNTYMVTNTITGQGGGNVYYGFVYCDPGDKVLGGGGGAFAFEDDLTESGPVFNDTFGEGWRTFVQDNGFNDNVDVEAVCADFPPLRP